MEDTASSLQVSFCSESTSIGEIPSNLKKPFSTTRWRWGALILMNLLVLGYYVVYDCPQPLETSIKSTLGLNDRQYSYFYSFLAVPNIILPMVAGYVVDSIGVRPAMITFTILILIGQSIVTYGAYISSFTTMIIGRVVFALGGDPLIISQTVMVNKWFKGKEVAFALSLCPLIAGSGKALNSVVVPIIYNYVNNLHTPLAFGSLLCLLSGMCAAVVIVLDRIDEERVHAAHLEHEGKIHVNERMKLSDIKKFNLMVWLLVINFGLTDGLVFTLRSFMNDFYYVVYGFTNAEAGYMIAAHYLSMGFIAPIGGKLVDKFGYRASVIFYNSLFGVAGIFFLTFYTDCQRCLITIIPLIMFGLYIGIDDIGVAPSLPLVLKEKYLGTGYGLFYSTVNTLLFVLPYVCGYIKDKSETPQAGYFWVCCFLCFIAVIVAIESFFILATDRRRGRVLDKYIPIKSKPNEPTITSADYLEMRL